MIFEYLAWVSRPVPVLLQASKCRAPQDHQCKKWEMEQPLQRFTAVHSHHTERTHRTSASAREAAQLRVERDRQAERIKELEARLAVESSGLPTVPIAQAEAVVERVAGDVERKGMAGVAHVQAEAEAEHDKMRMEYELRISQATKQLQDQHLHLERVKNENNQRLATLESQITAMTTQGQMLQRHLMETEERA